MPKRKTEILKPQDEYSSILSGVVELLEQSRRLAARSVNAIMTATYWEIGRRIVEVEQKGEGREEYYGKEIVDSLAKDLTRKFGRGFGRRNLFQMRAFYLTYSNIQSLLSQNDNIVQTPSAQSANTDNIVQTVSGQSFSLAELAKRFPLPWSHYVLLLSCRDENERNFYEAESLRGGWSVRQLKRQKDSQFYKRTLLSKNKAAMLEKGEKALPEDTLAPDEEIKDPFVMEFLNLKDALDLLPNKVLAKEYKTVLPDEKILIREIEKNRRMLNDGKIRNPKSEI
jgi:hypothetical protein